MEQARAGLSVEDCRELVLVVFRTDLLDELDQRVSAHRQEIVAAVENWWGKYAGSLHIATDRLESAHERLSRTLKELGYA